MFSGVIEKQHQAVIGQGLTGKGIYILLPYTLIPTNYEEPRLYISCYYRISEENSNMFKILTNGKCVKFYDFEPILIFI